MAAETRSICYRPKKLVIFLSVIFILTANHGQVNASPKKVNDNKPKAIARRSNPDARILRDLEYIPEGHERNKLDLYLPKQSDKKDLKID